jgi:hypothetical protein
VEDGKREKRKGKSQKVKRATRESSIGYTSQSAAEAAIIGPVTVTHDGKVRRIDRQTLYLIVALTVLVEIMICTSLCPGNDS